MPILHVQYEGQSTDRDGKHLKISSASALAKQGPIVQAIIGIGTAFSEELAHQGIASPGPVAGSALIDTGASTTCIDDSIAWSMGIPSLDKVLISSASHPATQQHVYAVTLEIVGSPIRLEVPRAVGASLQSQGLIALIGRDFLQHCTLHYNGVIGAVTLSV